MDDPKTRVMIPPTWQILEFAIAHDEPETSREQSTFEIDPIPPLLIREEEHPCS
jgi:hypothetical protein